MTSPLDLFVRVSALPRIAWAASGSIFEARRRFADAVFGDPISNEHAGRMYDGFFDRVEEQCRTRWCEVFGNPSTGDATEPDESKAA